jgi:hypothetical protein
MRTIETVVTVDERGMVTLRMPPDVPPGEHKVVMVIEEAPFTRPKFDMSSFPRHDVSPWPFGPTETFRREDLYGDDGR